ncbi:alpha/beta fold hydrolase [Pseudonocardia acidicola]|uniref:Alpha/beta fold hydrolase n=1 Tax=Pseudonocardia acidicola TaxID=2724939 RepID=A0ABX1S6T1_9PSEU|nr:alpha/beta hydrolase [Pseudonocardia acidicola]NMH96517.1 alpha/beta fold hydrolase [Pseudonocardia acidicola]
MSAPADVVLLHGVGLDHTMWERLAPGLAARHHVLTPDLRGHGTAPDAAPGLTLSDLATDIARLMRGLDGPAHLVGFSLGALVATEVALDNPELVASLTLVSGVANRSAAERDAVAGRLRASRTDLDATFLAAVDRWFSPTWKAAEPALAERVLATLRANRPESYLACYSVFADADAQLWPRLRELTMPVLAITGAEDTGSTPAMSTAVAAQVPDGRWAVVRGARHLLPLERPDAVLDAVVSQIDGRTSTHPPGALLP